METTAIFINFIELATVMLNKKIKTGDVVKMTLLMFFNHFQ